MAKLRRLRGTSFDPFGHTKERRLEKQLIQDYKNTVAALVETLSDDNCDLAMEIAALPEQIRGFGPIKSASVGQAAQKQAALLARFHDAPG